MPQITKSSLALALAVAGFFGVLSMAGCGDEAKQANYDAVRGNHPEHWLAGHIPEALAHLDNCTQCHGQELSGGISKVSCSLCHAVTLVNPANPAQGIAIHPPEWDDLVYARHANYVEQRGTLTCASTFCHGVALNGGLGPSCSSCHIGGPLHAHPVGWNTQQDFANNSPPLHGQYVLSKNSTASCRNAVCHGTQLQGVLLSGPACAACHPGTTFP
jgi:LSD1 subclass zinc finger protein